MCITEGSGEHIVAGCGELHVEICLNDLQNEYAKCELKKSDPVVTYKETVTELSNQLCLSKSQNKHNRIFMQAEPLGDDLTNDIEKDLITSKMDAKERVKLLTEKHEWDKNDALKFWCFGTDTSGPNIQLDNSYAAYITIEIKEPIETTFQRAPTQCTY